MTSSSLSFECPRCRTMITVEAKSAGSPSKCPNCAAAIVVPGNIPKASDAFDDLFLIDDSGEQPSYSQRGSPDEVEPLSLPRDDAKGPPSIPHVAPPSQSPPDLGDDLLDLMPVEMVQEPELASATDPFAHDENSPLRLDEVTGDHHLPNQIRVKCPICDSVMFASEAQIGQKIQCSDCFSMIDVVAPEKHAPASTPPLDRAGGAKDSGRLSAFPEREIEPEEPIGESYGLEPASDDLLTPRPEMLSPELMEMIQQTHFSSATTRPTPIPTQSPAPLPPVGPTVSPAAPSAMPKPPPQAPEKGPTYLPMSESELPKVDAPPPPLEKVPLSEQFKWPEQFLCVFKDLNALQILAMVAVVLAIGYVVIDWGIAMARFEDVTGSGAKPYRLFGFGIVMIAGAIHLIAMVLSGIMINQTVEGAAYKRSVFDPPELGVGELISSFLVTGVSFWAGMLPGIVLGQLFWGATGRWWLTYVVAFGTAFFLAPIGILGAYYNGSAFQIISSEVARSVRTHAAGWIRFYFWMVLWIGLFCFGWAFRMIPNSLFGSSLCAVVQASSLLLMGRTLGLLAQAFINFWIDDD